MAAPCGSQDTCKTPVFVAPIPVLKTEEIRLSKSVFSQEDKVKGIYSHYFSSYTDAAFNSNIGLSLQEVCYVIDKYSAETSVTPLAFMMALHFAWKYPEGHYGGVIWKMCRQQYAFKVWKAVNVIEAFMNEIKMENRLKSAICIDGPAAYCTLHTDSSDFMVHRPQNKEDQKEILHVQEKKVCHAICHSRICQHWRLTLGVIWEGLVEKLHFFERVGADGAYLCRRDPMYKCPHRKPRGGQLTPGQVQQNAAFGNYRSIVENIFARTKQFACMRDWRHKRSQHPIIARFVFQLVQVKQKFRPIRKLGISPEEHAELTVTSWRDAEREGVPAIMPESKSKRKPDRRGRVRRRKRKLPSRPEHERKRAILESLPSALQRDATTEANESDDADEEALQLNDDVSESAHGLLEDTDSGSSGDEQKNSGHETGAETDYGVEDRVVNRRGRNHRVAKMGALLGMRAACLNGEKMDRLMRRARRREKSQGINIIAE
ncbi:hypothetical protein AAMO2058_001544700 [Amorphochlora amoebiformis]